MAMTLEELRNQLSAIEPDEGIYAGIGSSEIPLLEQLRFAMSLNPSFESYELGRSHRRLTARIRTLGTGFSFTASSAPQGFRTISIVRD